METKKFARIEVETLDPEQPPTADNLRIYFDGKDISHTTTGIEVRAMVGELTSVTLHLYANVSIDGLVIHKEGAE